MAKTAPKPPDMLVLGDHPCAYLASAILAESKTLRLSQAIIPGEKVVDRLVTINPAFFELHKILAPLKSKLDLQPIHGLKFLADNPAISSSHVHQSVAAYVASYKQLRSEMQKLAQNAGVEFRQPAKLQIRQLDESGVKVEIDEAIVHAKLLLLAGELPPEQKRMIGLPPQWDQQAIHRWTALLIKGALNDQLDKTLLPMSLDLGGTMHWAWLLAAAGKIQIAIEQPLAEAGSAQVMLQKWIDVLVAHKIIRKPSFDWGDVISLNLPLGGALSQEGVANRTLLIGPAGGFYTACAEDIYPNCWSAVCAAEVAQKAITQRHVQDALQEYHQCWGTKLGDYLRGPQENLKFLLPLVYRNSVMTARLAEAILFGKSVVR
jgi:flavin-dependent dehydrogenase